MPKSTKERSHDNGGTTVKPVKEKAARRETKGKNAGTKSMLTAKKGVTKKATTKKTATKKVAAKSKQPDKKTVASKANAKKKAAPRKKGANGSVSSLLVSSTERHQMIAEIAYLIAESKGFLSDEHENWFHAEIAVDCLLTREGVIVSE